MKRCIIFLFFSVLSVQLFANTTVIFEVPEPSLKSGREYIIDRRDTGKELLVLDYLGRSQKGKLLPPFLDSKNHAEDITFFYNKKEYAVNFPTNSGVNDFIVDNFVDLQREAEEAIRSSLLNQSRVKSVNYVDVQLKPLTVRLEVSGNKVNLYITGLSLAAKARASTGGGIQRLLCGSTVTTETKVSLSAVGEYHVGSGLASIRSISPKVSSDIECSGVIGELLDPI